MERGITQIEDARYAYARIRTDGTIHEQDGPSSCCVTVDLTAVPDGVEIVVVPADRSGSYGAGWSEGVRARGPVRIVAIGGGYAAAFAEVAGHWHGGVPLPAFHGEVRWRAGHGRTGDHSGYARFVADAENPPLAWQDEAEFWATAP